MHVSKRTGRSGRRRRPSFVVTVASGVIKKLLPANAVDGYDPILFAVEVGEQEPVRTLALPDYELHQGSNEGSP